MRWSGLVFVAAMAVWGATCGQSKPADIGGAVGMGGDDSDGGVTDDAGITDDAASDLPPPLVLPPECATAATPPKTLVCTGLYADIVAKQIAPGVTPYAPAVPLWSDGAEKQRWISLPAGSVIDTSDPSEWKFPVGTKAWKEFSRDGRRVETRLWHKVTATYWVDATYAWNNDETEATQSGGGDIPWGDGGTYHIPTDDECQKCHRGRTDRLLGFEQIELGLPGASGMTLDQLVASGSLSVPPASTAMIIGDDGTGVAAPALAWMHANCGVTCHNDNPGATGYPSGLRLRLDATQMDGRSSADFDSLRTTVGVSVNAPNWAGQTRIIPGDPDHSLLYHLITNRGTGNQMPPIATSVVDIEHTPLIQAWIAAMPPLPAPPPEPATEPAPEPAPEPSLDGGVDDAVDAASGDEVAPPDDSGALVVPDDAAPMITADDAGTPDDAGNPDGGVDADGGPDDALAD
ncbi:MAG TPA: hypothetical protein VMU50_18260 [Polyangia bacterium]|nr:hypothetical protein [Polyangia bacterium]